MSAALHHLRVSAWTSTSWLRRLYGVFMAALLMPAAGLLIFNYGDSSGPTMGVLAMAGLLLMGPVLGGLTLPGDKGSATLPALPLSPEARATAEALGVLLPPLALATLLPLAGRLAFEPLIEPAFEDWQSPAAVLFWGWAYWGDSIAQYALVGLAALAPGVLMGAHDRMQGLPLGWPSALVGLFTAAAAYALHPLGPAASVAGMLAVLVGVAVFGQALAERLRDVTWRPRAVGALHRAPFTGRASELLSGFGEALGRALILLVINATVWGVMGIGEPEGQVELWMMVLLFPAILCGIPPRQFFATHGGAPFDLSGALGWLPRSKRWHVQQVMAQAALTFALVVVCSAGLVGAGLLRPVAALSVLGVPLVIAAPISARVAGGRGAWLGFAGLGAYFVAVMAEMIASVPFYPDLPLWLAAIPGSVVGVFSVPALVLAWVDSAEG